MATNAALIQDRSNLIIIGDHGRSGEGEATLSVLTFFGLFTVAFMPAFGGSSCIRSACESAATGFSTCRLAAQIERRKPSTAC
ncbi:MAG: hypothetical protein NTZ90_10750 [Proteobacteria bacterium]|nr:hypothetical protein [Pseudomonadota bacterium]